MFKYFNKPFNDKYISIFNIIQLSYYKTKHSRNIKYDNTKNTLAYSAYAKNTLTQLLVLYLFNIY